MLVLGSDKGSYKWVPWSGVPIQRPWDTWRLSWGAVPHELGWIIIALTCTPRHPLILGKSAVKVAYGVVQVVSGCPHGPRCLILVL